MPVTRKQSVKKKVVLKKKIIDKGVLGEIEPLGAGLEAGIKMVLYGRTGTGKTTLWSTFPKPILALICSGVERSGEVRSILTPQNCKSIEQWVVTGKDGLVELCHALKEENSYKTIVLDHATGLQDLLLKQILGLEELPAQGSWGMASRDSWGTCTLQSKECLRSLLNLSCNTVIVAQEREFNTEVENDMLSPYVGAALTPSTTGWLNHTCDYICQTFIRQQVSEKKTKIGGKVITQQIKGKGVQYCLRTAPHDVYMTRFRIPREKSDSLPEQIVNPTYQKIEELIEI